MCVYTETYHFVYNMYIALRQIDWIYGGRADAFIFDWIFIKFQIPDRGTKGLIRSAQGLIEHFQLDFFKKRFFDINFQVLKKVKALALPHKCIPH